MFFILRGGKKYIKKTSLYNLNKIIYLKNSAFEILHGWNVRINYKTCFLFVIPIKRYKTFCIFELTTTFSDCNPQEER